MIIKLQIDFDGTEDFVLFCIFHEIEIKAIYQRSGVLGSYYFAFIICEEDQFKEIEKGYKIIKVIKHG